jgi:hypothetical protein
MDETSPFEATRILDPEPNPAIVEESRKNLVRAFPAFARPVAKVSSPNNTVRCEPVHDVSAT